MLIGKPLAAFVIVLGLGYSVRAAILISIVLGQIGEFTFILSSGALRLGIFSAEGQSALIAVALISISLNPLLFSSALRVERWLEGKPKLWNALNVRAQARARRINAMQAADHAQREDEVRAVVIGYGPVGRTVTRILQDFGIRPVVIELNIDTVDALTKSGIAAVYGDAARPEILTAAGVQRARFLLVTIPDLASRAPVITAVRQLNENIVVISRARYVAEQTVLGELGVKAICYEEIEAAVGLSEFVLANVGVEEQLIRQETERIRAEFAV